MGGTRMGISVIRPSELGPAEITAWHDMQRMTPALANPFLSPEFTIAVGRVRPPARVAVLTDGQDITGFFPFELRKFGVGVPIAAGLTDCQGLIHAPAARWDARALLSACRISVWHFDHLVSGQKPFERYQSALAASPVIDLSGGFGGYYASLKTSSPVFCSQLARKGRKLGREIGELRLVTNTREVSLLRMLMGWKSDQYQRTGRLDRFSTPWIIELLDLLLETRTSNVTGILSVLYADETPVAAHFGLQSSSILAYWFPAYDTRFAKFSPGLLHHIRFIEDRAAADIQLIDFGKGAKHYKETLKSYDLFVAEGIATRPSITAAAHWTRSAPQAWLIRQIRAHPPLFRAADTLLRRGAQVRSSLLTRKTLLPDHPQDTVNPATAHELVDR
jgi:CelD/BcsL family acetyltransferase involved in cellulose biosynthesis